MSVQLADSFTWLLSMKCLAYAGGGQATADTTESQDLGFGDKLETEEQRKLREHVFLSESFPKFLSLAGFFGCAAIAAGIIPKIFPPARWYQILVMFAFGPLFSIANSYAAGLINWNLASTWGKLSLVVFAAWSGKSYNGVASTCTTSAYGWHSWCTCMQNFMDVKVCLSLTSQKRSLMLHICILKSMLNHWPSSACHGTAKY